MNLKLFAKVSKQIILPKSVFSKDTTEFQGASGL